MKKWRTGITRMAIAIAVTAVALTGAATMAAAAQPAPNATAMEGVPHVVTASVSPSLAVAPMAGTLFGCRAQWACLYTDNTDTMSASHPHTDYFNYGFDNFSNVTGTHWIANNQTGGAPVYLCRNFGGTNCPPFTVGGITFKYIPAGVAVNYNMTPINSIRLCASC